MRSSFKNLTQKLSLNEGLTIPEIFQGKSIPSLNGLRAVAIFCVIAQHIKRTANCPCIFYKVDQLVPIGSFGVQIFFVISGFLITGLLLKEKVQTGTISFRRFYWRRVIRILPAFYFFLLVILICKNLHFIHVDNEGLLASALFYMNFLKLPDSWVVAHSWSLSVEEQFYLIWPMIMVFLPRKYYFVIVITLLYSIFYYYLRYNHFLFMFRGFLINAPALIAGALLAIGLYKGWFTKIHKKLLHPIFAFSLMIAAIIYIPRSYQFAPFFYRPFDYILSSVFMAAFVYYTIYSGPKNWIYKILNLSVISYIGILSYSIYLWQQPFMSLPDVYHGEHVYWTRVPQNLLFIFIAALISYYVVERPFLKLKKHFQ